jgi:hypothetical protein
MNDFASVLGITSLENGAKILGSSQRDLMKMSADGKIIIREINGKFFVEVDSIKKMIQEAPIFRFEDSSAA